MNTKSKLYFSDISNLVVTDDTPMQQVLKIMAKNKFSTVIVTNANRELEGIITGSDIVRELEKSMDSPVLLEGAAKYVMTNHVETVVEDAIMLEAIDKMFRRQLHQLVVTRGFNPIGLITQLDVIRWWSDRHLVKR
jgi:CBS domain-containing protein